MVDLVPSSVEWVSSLRPRLSASIRRDAPRRKLDVIP